MPFIRPSPKAESHTARAASVRKQSRVLPPLGHRWAEYELDRDQLAEQPDAQDWALVAAERHTCTVRHCPRFRQCSYYQARNALAEADVIVANHDLVLASLGMKTLPDLDNCLVVFDEGHHLPATALDQFACAMDLSRTTWLDRLAALISRYQPASFSEHLAWSSHGGTFFNDLLPVPYDRAMLDRVCRHIERVQERLKRRMLLENPSVYLDFAETEMDEIDFLAEIVRRTGCGLLLDVNNVFVSSTNRQIDPNNYIDRFPHDMVGEIHLGGHDEDIDDHGAPLLIDSHGKPVVDPVWALYARTIATGGPKPTLIEWDNDVPDWPTLQAEAALAHDILVGAST